MYTGGATATGRRRCSRGRQGVAEHGAAPPARRSKKKSMRFMGLLIAAASWVIEARGLLRTIPGGTPAPWVGRAWDEDDVRAGRTPARVMRSRPGAGV